MKKLLIGILSVVLLGGCHKEDGRDDTILDMSYLTGKDWYYNGWLGDKYSFGAHDLLEVIRLEKGGALKSIEFGGRKEYTVGSWSSDGDNRILLSYNDGTVTKWNVQHSGNDYIKTIVNEQGVREYTLKPGYLGDLTADAFLVNEYTSGNEFKTYIGADVRGNIDLREGNLILAAGNTIALQGHEYFWSEKNPVYIDFEGNSEEIRFYLRLSKDIQLKLSDSIYSGNLPQRMPSEVALNVIRQDGNLQVSWNPYTSRNVYYRVEILSKDMDLVNPYFISQIQHSATSRLEVKPTTAGEINRLSDMKSGDTYVIRLSAILYEPDVDPWNDNYGYANVQAVTYFTKKYLND